MKETLSARLDQARIWLLRQVFRGSYSQFYRHFMRLRSARDPQAAVGGLWEEMGRLQFDTLKRLGLEPGHHLLDIGCGALRGGVHFIGYLEPGHYTGLDISEHILEAGRKMLPPGLLEEKRPLLKQNRDLRFAKLPAAQFDFALAQSVFTHTPRADIEECLAALPRVMRPDGSFCFTVFLAATERYESGAENFYFPEELILDLCARHGWQAERVEPFDHPRGQVLFHATRNSAPGTADTAPETRV